ncbi:MAG: AraC family transcriptional regulator [Bosea sp.]|uniref:AraC family transcriptional regulator n=1 Tax=Bosea sp. (in: a-proteobacteria) TaxID=1871050 RepID=UPI00239036E0|nr:AraC family transcriptional regulator [Bosea sp. (in: a-proteobacteria)]MCP4736820.1 AraC family transcriptional regulator [Bosea sp. (in: a-proteobacteria)]
MIKLPQRQVEAFHSDHRHIHGTVSDADGDVLVRVSDNPAGYTIPPHSHRQIQLLCAFSGVVQINTERGSWMIPPGHGLLIPARLQHSVEMLSDVSIKSVYLVSGHDDLTERMLQVLGVTELAHALIVEAIRLRDAPPGHGKLALVLELLTAEIAALPIRPLGLPIPADRRLSALCRAYMAAPSVNERLDDWAAKLAMSRRTFTRLFQRETGLSFVAWRQQASLFACLPRLAEGMPVTEAAMLAGYDNVAAFTTMFRRRLGTAPRNYMKASLGR